MKIILTIMAFIAVFVAVGAGLSLLFPQILTPKGFSSFLLGAWITQVVLCMIICR